MVGSYFGCRCRSQILPRTLTEIRESHAERGRDRERNRVNRERGGISEDSVSADCHGAQTVCLLDAIPSNQQSRITKATSVLSTGTQLSRPPIGGYGR